MKTEENKSTLAEAAKMTAQSKKLTNNEKQLLVDLVKWKIAHLKSLTPTEDFKTFFDMILKEWMRIEEKLQ